MNPNSYRLLGAGILIGALGVTLIWLLSGEQSYSPERDYQQRGAPLIVTQPPAASETVAPAEIIVPPAEIAALGDADSALQQLQSVLPDINATPEAERAQAVPQAESEPQLAPEPPTDNFQVQPQAASSGQQLDELQQAIVASDSTINSLISSIQAQNPELWRIDVASFRDQQRADQLVQSLQQLLAEQLGEATVSTERGLRERTNTYFYTIVIGTFPSEADARRLSVPIKDAYPDIRRPRIRRLQP